MRKYLFNNDLLESPDILKDPKKLWGYIAMKMKVCSNKPISNEIELLTEFLKYAKFKDHFIVTNMDNGILSSLGNLYWNLNNFKMYSRRNAAN